MDAFVESVQERVSGVVRLKLFKGSFNIVGRTASNFIRISGPPVELVARKAPDAGRQNLCVVK
ncbi:hypothetical protein B4Q13_22710 [Lacticaseibacillus rhamnosus]